jgi:hypothetical protein
MLPVLASASKTSNEGSSGMRELSRIVDVITKPAMRGDESDMP